MTASTLLPHPPPAQDSHLDPHRAGAQPGTRAPSPLRVLVAEDDPDTLAVTVEVLEMLGHWVAGAQSAEIALARFVEGAFDVLLLDVHLPGLSGLSLAQKLRRLQPLPVIFATGDPQQLESVPGAVWLRKPYTVEQLQDALERAGAVATRSAP